MEYRVPVSHIGFGLFRGLSQTTRFNARDCRLGPSRSYDDWVAGDSDQS